MFSIVRDDSMNDIFKENNYYMTLQGLKYLMSKRIMNQIEDEEAVNVLANIEMGVEGRIIIVNVLVLLLYINLATTNMFNVGLAAIISLLIPGVFYYIFDYLFLYKIPLVPYLLRIIEIVVFKFFVNKILMLILSLTIFHNVWIFVCYVGFAIGKLIIGLISSFDGKKYVLFLRKREAYHNNKIGNYFLKLFN